MEETKGNTSPWLRLQKEEGAQSTCKQCGLPIQMQQGHRPRWYCSAACKQRAFRLNQVEKRRDALRSQWKGYRSKAQEELETLMRVYGEDAAQLATNALKQL